VTEDALIDELCERSARICKGERMVCVMDGEASTNILIVFQLPGLLNTKSSGGFLPLQKIQAGFPVLLSYSLA